MAMTSDSFHAAFLELAEFVEQRQLVQNRELWERHVSRLAGGRATAPQADALERLVRLFQETERRIASGTDDLSPRENRQWRVIRAFFHPYQAPPQVLIQLNKWLRSMEAALSQRAPRAKILPVNRHRRWRCWRAGMCSLRMCRGSERR
jgi:hypothetical protein